MKKTFTEQSQFISWAFEFSKNWNWTDTLQVSAGLYRGSRNLEQNALYWTWLKQIGDYLGESDEYYHDYFRAIFLVKIFAKKDPNGFGMLLDLVEDVKSKGMPKEYETMMRALGKKVTTTQADVEQFTEYLESIQRHMLRKHNFTLRVLE